MNDSEGTDIYVFFVIVLIHVAFDASVTLPRQQELNLSERI